MTDRDTHFADFAKLLWHDLAEELGSYIDRDGFSRTYAEHPECERIITQRAYDLVGHVLNSLVNDHLSIDYDLHYWPNEQLIDEYIPDLTQWPTKDELQ